ncbi:hypothetical protein JMX53_12730 [Cutibacterium avidum]|uniref:hypothetical protein n=1 Tax=Cutibacterium avidum TaxID=33010 RepID=UPI00192A8AA4|nr:hypothetical protein [Cutibacterium avidum]QQY15035.1 hypothetical protein JMX53_12730 [Cutibacterium avidum]DAI62779.1 MAG TPA: Protein of unknown function (DUF2892) [Caudoviricetes sp.]
MARRIGADMLANLDRQLAAGTISPAQHEARRTEVLEMIRTGKDLDVSTAERTVRQVAAIAVLVVGIIYMGSQFILSHSPLAWVFGIAGAALAVWGSYRIGHPRAR